MCGVCDAESASRWQREAWHLVEEQMLLEARITLLKLAARLDAIYAEVRLPELSFGRHLCKHARIMPCGMNATGCYTAWARGNQALPDCSASFTAQYKAQTRGEQYVLTATVIVRLVCRKCSVSLAASCVGLLT